VADKSRLAYIDRGLRTRPWFKYIYIQLFKILIDSSNKYIKLYVIIVMQFKKFQSYIKILYKNNTNFVVLNSKIN